MRTKSEAVAPVRPEFVTDEHLTFLDDLREEGTMNMYGAPRFVANEFGLSFEQASKITSYWMDTFGKENR